MKRSYVRFRTWLIIIIMTVALAACISTPPPSIPPAATPTPADTTTPAQRLAAVTKIASVDDTELLVQPLHDLQIDDLRKAAKVKREAGNLAAAAAELDHALALVANDPAMLQERAEIALLQGDWAGAEHYAERAIRLGSKTGPLCRRHWATIEQARLARGETENASSAYAQIERCTVPGIKRY
ncbi:hypothetical protein FUT69_04005 [Xylella taiwanensis]|uniref:Tetratricopeptide repeat protein n=1 Tax=Xylella taiwanensis TaxID=1444770 RepID=Z9JMK1_9GAMM|nr:hypothetical protein [Xylella taiwanensis]AXI84432.1 hypothetical protein AB672_11115 [Xylella taiwanensis]EWS79409.1 hypothetical protein AF72_01010 [Xylella taiwanensis]MCD8455327.1 hypothetical protein [Xylella taiwanensis]MCD8457732.1 hypothetical protein [Xylella taiwanensis]MCD8459868.1 hypothetical protein [Xylella taiwanensis]